MKRSHEFLELKKMLARAYKGVQHIEAWPALLDMPGEFQNRIVEPIRTALKKVEDMGQNLSKRPIIERR